MVLIPCKLDNLLVVYSLESPSHPYPQNNNSSRDRQPPWLLIMRTSHTNNKKTIFLFVLYFLSENSFSFRRWYATAWPAAPFILMGVKAEDLECCLFTHTALIDRKLCDHISPAAWDLTYCMDVSGHMMELKADPKTCLSFIQIRHTDKKWH